MNANNQKALTDFSKFRVFRVSRGETDSDGFTAFDLEGEFDRVIERQGEITWFYLLTGDRNAVCVQWKSFDNQSRNAILVAREKKLPDVEGKTLYYLSPAWRPQHIWMVLNE
jgi:hypothetical protein